MWQVSVPLEKCGLCGSCGKVIAFKPKALSSISSTAPLCSTASLFSLSHLGVSQRHWPPGTVKGEHANFL
jgi:hypothetical protein